MLNSDTSPLSADLPAYWLQSCHTVLTQLYMDKCFQQREIVNYFFIQTSLYLFYTKKGNSDYSVISCAALEAT